MQAAQRRNHKTGKCASSEARAACIYSPNDLKGNRVCLRYTADGHHAGEPHGEIPPNGRKAQWTASALFQVQDGKLSEFIKDWNKLSM